MTGFPVSGACMIMAVLAALLWSHAESAGIQKKKVKKEMQQGFIPGREGNLAPDQSELVKTFDTAGNLVEEKDRQFLPSLQKVVEYDKMLFYGNQGKLDSTVIYFDGQFSMKLETLFDSSGRETAVQEYNSERNPSFRTVFIYNGRGQKMVEEMYTPEGKLYNFRDFKYDRKGNIIEESGKEGRTPRYRWAYTYDKNNRLVRRRDYSGKGMLMQKHIYRYNAEGQISEEKVLDAKGEVERVVQYTYEYH